MEPCTNTVSPLYGIAENCNLPLLHHMMFGECRQAEYTAEQLLSAFCTDPAELRNRQAAVRALTENPLLHQQLYTLVAQLTEWREYLADNSPSDLMGSLSAFSRLEFILNLLVTLSDNLNQPILLPPYLGMLRDFFNTLFIQIPIRQLQKRWPELISVKEEEVYCIDFGLNFNELYEISSVKMMATRQETYAKKNLSKNMQYHEIKRDSWWSAYIRDGYTVAQAQDFIEYSSYNAINGPSLEGLTRQAYDIAPSKCPKELLPADNQSLYDGTLSILSTMTNLCTADSVKLVRQYINRLYTELTPLRSEMEFYLGAVGLINYFKQKQMPWCFPDLTTDKGFSAKGLYNPYLIDAKRLSETIVSNDVTMNATGEIDIITGANQGGKTTYLTSVALAQFMAQLGLPVAADEAAVGIADTMVLVFASQEQNLHVSGRLGQEIGQIAAALQMVRGGNVFFAFNEPLTGTSSADATVILVDVVAALKLAGARGVLVTHLFGLADRVERLNELSGSRCENLIAEVEQTAGGTTPLYIIKPGCPEHTSYAYDVVRRVGLTAERS